MKTVRIVYISKNPLTGKIQEIQLGYRSLTGGSLEVVRVRAHDQLHIAKVWGIKNECDMKYLPNSIYVKTISDGVAICRYDTKRVYKNRGRKRKVMT